MPAHVAFTLTGTRQGANARGLARQIRERTNNLEEQISEAIRISLDSGHRHQFNAIQWLAERAFGRVPELTAFAELDQAEAHAAIQNLNATQLETLAQALTATRYAKNLASPQAQSLASGTNIDPLSGQSTGSQTLAPVELSVRADTSVALETR